MLSVILWAAMSVVSFALFLTLPAGPEGTNYIVLVPGLIALTAAVLQATQFRDRAAHKFAVSTPADFDNALITRTEKIKNDKWQEQDRMLRHQSSRRRAIRK